MWGLDHKDSWAPARRIDTFEVWCWRRLLRICSTARRWNQSILKEINLEYSLEGLLLKLQYSGHLMRRDSSLEKTLMLGKIAGGEGVNRRQDGCMTLLIQWTWVWANSARWWRTGRPGVLHSMGSQSRTQLRDWMILTYLLIYFGCFRS